MFVYSWRPQNHAHFGHLYFSSYQRTNITRMIEREITQIGLEQASFEF